MDMSRRGFAGATLGAMVLGAAGTISPALAIEEFQWDEEHDLVIVGAGNGLFGAMAAQQAGADVVVLEKASVIGGTVRFSEGCVWAPGNAHMPEENRELDTVENVVEFMMHCDVYGNHDRATIERWVNACGPLYTYLEETVGVPFYALPTAMHDYYGYPQANAGRTMLFGDGSSMAWWNDSILPVIEAAGLDIRTETPATKLVANEDGEVVGVIATDASGKELRIRARRGVLLATGGFDHNKEMVDTYLQPPLVGTRVPAEITGDGIAMGLGVGARVAHMGENYHIPLAVSDEESVVAPMLWWSMCPGTILVGPDGKRFVNESSCYDEQGRAMRNFAFSETGSPACLSGNSLAIMDSRCVSDWGWPGGGSEQPAWVHSYNSIEELAEGEGISSDALVQEVERYNGFCDTGVDEDFHRGEGPYDGVETGCYRNILAFTGHDSIRDDLPNYTLAPLSEPPYYAVRVGRGSISTSGGLVTNGDAQVLGADGPIAGLYAAGCTADAVIDGYPGGGFPNSCAIMGSLLAVNHALELNLV